MRRRARRHLCRLARAPRPLGTPPVSSRACVCSLADARSPRSLARRADPWNLVLFGLIGGYVGSLVQPVEQQLLADVNEMRAERNMPPLKRDGGIFSLVKVDESKP